MGIDVKEGFQALAKFFFNSDEYLAQGNDTTAFVTDLYRTFLDRDPDAGGLTFWVNYLSQGLTRDMLITNFAYCEEFGLYTMDIFGAEPTRPENNLVNDLYRGFLNRFPDTGGFNHWLKNTPTMNMRSAQCSGAAAVRSLTNQIALAFIQSDEYTNRHRNNNQYVEDLYNGIHLQDLISRYDFNHRNALLSYLRARGIIPSETADAVSAELPSGERLIAEFDRKGQLRTINGEALI